MLFALLVMYLQSALMFYVMFCLFNAFMGVGFNKRALKLTEPDRNIVLIAPLAGVIITLLSEIPILGLLFSGFLGSILTLVGVVFVFAYFRGFIKL